MKALIAYAFITITAIISFTFLAYKTGHWWIALFSVLFMYSYHERSDK